MTASLHFRSLVTAKFANKMWYHLAADTDKT